MQTKKKTKVKKLKKTPLEAIVSNMGMSEANYSLGMSLRLGCKFWETQLPDVLATNYNIDSEHPASLEGKDCLYFFNRKTGNRLLIGFAAIEGKLHLHLHQNEFLKSK